MPAVNWFLLASCLLLVFAFQPSSRLAAAYGVAVTFTMVITTVLVAAVARRRWNWSILATTVVIAPLLVVDTAFAAANIFKIPAGGWFPLAVGIAGFVIFTTWNRGRSLVAARIERRGLSIPDFVTSLANQRLLRHPGTGVYLHRTPGLVPPALLANLRHNESLHDTVVVLSVTNDERAHVHPAQRVRIVDHDLGFHEIELCYGFTDRPRVADDLRSIIHNGVSFDPDHTTFFLGRERIQVTDREGMAEWRERLFSILHRNAGDPATHFGLPQDRSVDIGTHIDI